MQNCCIIAVDKSFFFAFYLEISEGEGREWKIVACYARARDGRRERERERDELSD